MKKLLLVLLFVPLASCSKGDEKYNDCENEKIKEIILHNGL